MFSSNGIELSARQFLELKKLVDAYRQDDFDEYVNSKLCPSGDRNSFDSFIFDCYRTFCEKGLVYGDFDFIIDNQNRIFIPTEAAFDFIIDIEADMAIKNVIEKSTRRHDFLVAAFGAICGTISGGILGFLSGLFSEQIAAAVSQLLGS